MTDLAALLPHAPPMRLLTRKLPSAPGEPTPGARFEAVLLPSCPFVLPDHAQDAEPAAVDPMIGLELIAQAAACLQPPSEAGRPPASGMLVSCRKAQLFSLDLRVGDTLEVRVERLSGDAGFGSFTGEVRRGEQPLMTATLSVVTSDATDRENEA